MEKIREEYENGDFWNFLGLEVDSISPEQVNLKLPFKSSLLNIHGTIHGGVYASILDTTMGFTVRTAGYDNATTLEMNVHFLKAIKNGTIYSKGYVINQGRSTVLSRAELYNEAGEILAHATGTFRVMKNN